MSVDERLLAEVERLRIPLVASPSASDWKEWYHFLLFDRDSGVRVLANATLAGSPEYGEVQATLLVTVPEETAGHSTFGSAFSLEWKPDMVRRVPVQVSGRGVELRIDGRSSLLQMDDERAQLRLGLQAEAPVVPLLVTESAPFGSGFIGWGLIPGLRACGELWACGRRRPIGAGWFCYHDHNFGRFRWGEDIGWEWLVASAVTSEGRTLTLVLDRRTDKAHVRHGLPYLFLYLDEQLRKIFLGVSLDIRWQWSPSATLPPRLPGSMASLFSDQTSQRPESLKVEAADERDRLTLRINIESGLELVVPDNQSRQYTLIDELTGTADIDLTLRGETLSARGPAYAEYTH
jgi:hypothetical protein